MPSLLLVTTRLLLCPGVTAINGVATADIGALVGDPGKDKATAAGEDVGDANPSRFLGIRLFPFTVDLAGGLLDLRGPLLLVALVGGIEAVMADIAQSEV